MTRILHCADLHLTASHSEGDYSFDVLSGVVAAAEREQVDLLFFSGDVFDSFDDLQAVKSRFRLALEGLPSHTRLFFLPGNHEHLRAGGAALEAHDFGRAELLSELPYGHLILPEYDLELISVPHRVGGCAEFREWNPAARTQRWRFVLAHGLVPDFLRYIPLDESDGSVLDAQLFTHLDADYAALGHLHCHAAQTIGKPQLVYAGSARVWRKGEEGKRGFVIIDAGESLQWKFVAEARAGSFRSYPVPVDPDGSFCIDSCESQSWLKSDFIELIFSGFVDDEHAFVQQQKRFLEEWKSRVRILQCDSSNLRVVSTFASHPLALRFLEEWRLQSPSDPTAMEVWLKVRQLGLEALIETLEKG